MAHSRLEKIGTIYSRVTGLIRAGAMKLEDRPMWYEVYQMYPPELEPKFDRPASNEPIREIFYPEDVIRAKFHKRVASELPIWDLRSKEETVTQRMISLCSKLESESGLSQDDCFERALGTLRDEGLLVSKPNKELKSKVKPSEETQREPPAPPPAVDIRNIFDT